MHGGLEHGIYTIELVAYPQNIGADPPYFNPDYVPIITDAIADQWEVTPLGDGTYTLTIVRGTPVYTYERDRGLVGSLNAPGSPWCIRVEKDGSYTIRATDGGDPTLAWTVWRSGRSKVFVTLMALRFQDNQKWKFTLLEPLD